MAKKIISLCAVLAGLSVAFWIGRGVGADIASKAQTKRDVQLHKELIELDRAFFTNVVTRPSTMTSGRYNLEVRFAGKPEKISEIELEFSNGRLVKASKLPIQHIVQTGNVVSWEQYDSDEGPIAIFVGTIDGNEMWGRVYVEPGQGWHQGQPPVYGVWRSLPKSRNDAESQPDGAANGNQPFRSETNRTSSGAGLRR
jgi:hypothetical protein